MRKRNGSLAEYGRQAVISSPSAVTTGVSRVAQASYHSYPAPYRSAESNVEGNRNPRPRRTRVPPQVARPRCLRSPGIFCPVALASVILEPSRDQPDTCDTGTRPALVIKKLHPEGCSSLCRELVQHGGAFYFTSDFTSIGHPRCGA